jgi:hypothetical protein
MQSTALWRGRRSGEWTTLSSRETLHVVLAVSTERLCHSFSPPEPCSFFALLFFSFGPNA